MQPSLRTFFRWGGVFKAPSWFDGHLWCGLPPHVPQLTYRSLILIVVVVSFSRLYIQYKKSDGYVKNTNNQIHFRPYPLHIHWRSLFQ